MRNLFLSSFDDEFTCLDLDSFFCLVGNRVWSLLSVRISPQLPRKKQREVDVIEEHGMKLTNYKRICPQINADERELGRG